MKKTGLFLIFLLLIGLMAGCEKEKPVEETDVNLFKKIKKEIAEPFMLDGDRTYMANELLLPYLVGTWNEKEDGTIGYQLRFEEDCKVTLLFDNEIVLETPSSYIHLEPGGPCDEEMVLEDNKMKNSSGKVYATVDTLTYCITPEGDRMELVIYIEETMQGDKIYLMKAN